MNALWIVSNYPTPQNPGSGIFIQQRAAQVGIECQVSVLVRVPGFPPFGRYAAKRRALASLPDQESRTRYKVYYLRVPYIPQGRWSENLVTGLTSVLSAAAAVWWARKRKVRPDLIHAHLGLNVFTAAVLARWLKVPLVTTMYGSDINYGTEVRRGNMFRRWATLFGLRASRVVMGVSDALCRRVVALGIPSSRVVQIPNGFDEAKFFPMDKNEARRRLGLPLKGRIMLSVANLVPVKGVDILVDAFSRSRSGAGDVALYCVGDGPETEQLRAAVKTNGLEGKVFFVGQRGHSEIPLWMNACDLFVMASRNEGWPTVLSEVLGCGRPVVATAVGGIPEIIRHDFLGELVEPERPEALADAIDLNLGREFDAAAICSYAEQFRWSNIVPRVLEVYKSVVAES